MVHNYYVSRSRKCRKGTRMHSRTNTCRKICKPGSRRNAKTYRCRKIKTSKHRVDPFITEPKQVSNKGIMTSNVKTVHNFIHFEPIK